MALATETIKPLKNAKLLGPLDCNGQLLVNADPASFPPGGGGGSGNDTGTTTAILKGDGNHGFANAIAETDYASPASVNAKEDSSAHTADINAVNGQISTINGQITTINTSLGTKLTSSDLSSFAGTSSINTVGTITTGTWSGTAIAAGKVPALNGINVPTGDVSLNSRKITNLADPTNATDGASKQYVDAVAVGGVPHASAAAASTGNLTLSGEQTIDGVTTSASRVLAKNQTTQTQNGIYVTAAGGWTRATDADTGTEIAGSVFVSAGTINAGTTWAVTTAPPITIGSTSVVYTQTGANTIYSAGTGLSLTGSQFSLAQMAANTLKGNNTGGTAAPGDLSPSAAKTLLALNNVENTAVSTFAGSSNITTLGTITTGTVPVARVQPGAAGSTVSTVGANTLQLATPAAASYLRANTDGTVTEVAKTGVASDIGAESALTFNAPLSRSTNTVSMPAATGTTSPPAGTASGYTTAADWNNWTNLRVPTGRTIATSAPLTITTDAGVGNVADLNANRTIAMPAASATADGYLLKSDWSQFAVGAGRAVGVSGTGPITIGDVSPPITRVVFLAPITANFVITLPSAAGYTFNFNFPSLEIIDIVQGGAQTAAFGITLVAPAGQLIDGQGSYTLPKSMTYLRLYSDTVNRWSSSKYFIDAIRDPLDATRKANVVLPVSSAAWPTNTSRTFTIAAAANSVSVVPVALQAGKVMRGIGTDGAPLIAPLTFSEIAPTEYGAPGTVDDTITPDGSIDTVRITSALTGPRVYIFPPALNYSGGEKLTMYDATNSVSRTNYVRLAPSSGKINGNVTFDITEPFFARVFIADPINNNWTVSPGGGLSLDPWHSLTAGATTTIPCSADVVENHHIVTMSGATTLAFTGLTNGQTGLIKFRDTTGNHAVTVPISFGKTPTAGGVGTFTTSTGSNIEDLYRWTYDGSFYTFTPVGLKLAANSPPAFTTAADDTTTAISDDGTIVHGSTVGSKFIAARLVADGGVTDGSTYVIGKVRLRMGKIGTGASTNVTLQGYSNATDVSANSPNATIGTISSNVAVSGIATYAYTDGTSQVAPNASTFLSPAQASFVSTDVGKIIAGTNIPANTTITAVNSSTSVTLSNAATAAGTGLSFTIQRLQDVDFDCNFSAIGARVVTSITTTATNATLTGAPGQFLTGDVGCKVFGTNIPVNARITSVAAGGASATLAAGTGVIAGTASITIKNVYWLVFTGDNAAFTGTNFLYWEYHNIATNDVLGLIYIKNNSGGPWTIFGTNPGLRQMKYITYK